MMRRKGFISLFGTLLILILIGVPAGAEERTVLGICAPPFQLSYEKEGANHWSWIVNGLIFVDDTFEHYDISLNASGGIRHYQGDVPWRFYEGVYGLVAFKGVEVLPNDLAKTVGFIAALGFEGRFGENSKARYFVEAGWKVIYQFPVGSANGLTFGAGVGYGI